MRRFWSALSCQRFGLLRPVAGFPVLNRWGQYLSKYLVLDWKEQVLEANDQRRQFLRKHWDDVVRRDLKEMLR